MPEQNLVKLYRRTMVLPCERREVRRTYMTMTTESLNAMADSDLVLTRDGWVVKDRFGEVPREATAEEILLATQGDEE